MRFDQNKITMIAEIGINHNGDLNLAKEMVSAAKKSGAHVVKFQLYDAKKYISQRSEKPSYQSADKINGSKTQYEIIKETELSIEQMLELRDYANKLDIAFLVTPFEEYSLIELAKHGFDTVKVSSDNLNNVPFLKAIAGTNISSVILSTGMGTLTEVCEAYEVLKHKDLTIMQCTSAYPSLVAEANTSVIETYRELFGVPVGFSDHCLSTAASASAVVFGARVFEKHFTTSRSLPGIDQAASLEPDELSDQLKFLEDVLSSIGSKFKAPTSSEKDTRSTLRRSLYSINDLKKGQIVQACDIAVQRPGLGLSPRFFDTIVGQKTKTDLKSGSLLKLGDFDFE